jgi:hypothetical protein
MAERHPARDTDVTVELQSEAGGPLANTTDRTVRPSGALVTPTPQLLATESDVHVTRPKSNAASSPARAMRSALERRGCGRRESDTQNAHMP